MNIDGKDDACGGTGRAATLPLSLSDDATRSMFVRLFEAAGDVILIFDAHGLIEAANPALERILGYMPGEVRGLPLTMLLARERRSDIATVIANYAAQSEHVFVGQGAREIPVRTRAGEERFFEIVVEEIGSASPMFLAIGRDVTERRRRDDSLRSSEAVLRALVEFGTDIATVIGPDGTILFESPFTRNILGYGDENVNGTNALDFAHPDDRPRVEAEFFSILAEPGKHTELEARFLHKDGTTRILHLAGTNCLDRPAIGGVVIKARDVTERVAAEEARNASDLRLRQAQKSARMAVWDIHLPTGRMSWHLESGTLFGLAAGEREITTGQFLDQVHPDDRDALTRVLARTVEDGTENLTHEFRLRATGGGFLHVRALGGCIMDGTACRSFWPAWRRTSPNTASPSKPCARAKRV